MITVEKVVAALQNDPKVAAAITQPDFARDVVLVVVHALGMHINPNTDEICDPRPPPTPSIPRQQDVYLRNVRGYRTRGRR